MKRLTLFVIATASLLSLMAVAQTPTPPRQTPPQQQQPAASPGGSGAEGKIAVINTAAFRNGIQELKVRLDALNVEFEPKNKELQSLQENIENIKNKIQTQGPTVQPAVRNQWMEEGAALEKELKRKAEDYDALAKRRFEEVSGPIYDKIGNFLDQYAKKHRISMVLEVGAAQQSGLLVFAAATTDITEDFMREYNKANPATAASPSATGKP